MIYHFNFRNGWSLSKDLAGHACANDIEAIRHARELADEIINRPSRFGTANMSFDIVDTTGRYVGNVRFSP